MAHTSLSTSTSSTSTPDYRRRRLLAALMLSPLILSPLMHSPPTLAASHSKTANHLKAIDHPIDINRIIALEWLPTELLLALGVTPFGVADTHNYRLWVEEPALPASVIDVGQRTEPNLELLQQMAPSLLLLSQGYGPSPEKLAPIAPTMSFAFNEAGSSPLAVSKNSLRALGERLDLVAAAEQHLTDFDKVIAVARQNLRAYTQGPLLMFSLLDPRHALVVGKGSLFQDVLNLLNIENAWQGETNFWGSAVVGIERLATIKPGRAICFDHGNGDMLQQVIRTPLWQSLSFVRENQFRVLPPVWFYGATLSAMRFVRLLEQAWGDAS